MDAPLLNGRNGLHYAADYGQVNVVKYFCEKGAKVDVSFMNYLMYTIL